MDKSDSDQLETKASYTVVRGTWLSRRPATRAGLLTGWLILVLIVSSVFYWMDWWGLQGLMPASGEAVFQHKEYWRLWTTMFAHGDVKHLLSNCLTFFVVGYFLIGYFSLWFFPVTGFLLGGVANYFVIATYPPAVKLIGVSGVVYWMAGAWLVLYFLLDQTKTRTQRILRTLGVALGIFMPASAFDPSISYLTHAYGFALGIVSGGIYYWLFRKQFQKALRKEVITEIDPPNFNENT